MLLVLFLFQCDGSCAHFSCKVAEYLTCCSCGLVCWSGFLLFESLYDDIIHKTHAEEKSPHVSSRSISAKFLLFHTCHVQWHAKAKWYRRMNSPFKDEKKKCHALIVSEGVKNTIHKIKGCKRVLGSFDAPRCKNTAEIIFVCLVRKKQNKTQSLHFCGA